MSTLPRRGQSNGRNGNLAPPAYSVQDVHSVQHNIQAPLRYQNSSYSVTGYGTISPIKPLATPSSSYRLRDVLLHIFIGIIVGYMVQTPLDSRYRQGKRDEWALENEQHQEERTKWEHWVSARDSEKQKWDEEQAEKRSQIEWQGLQRRSCARYETRDYTATLFHVPLGLNAMEECRGKALQINGRDLLPSRCEDEGYCGKVTAHWEVNFNEPGCTPFFSEVLDKGCYGALRRYDARLSNIQEWDSWQAVCSTMSTAYGSVQLGPGASCSECNWGRCGHWATWMIVDARCAR